MSNPKVIISLNQINYICYFLIKEDRERLKPPALRGTITEKILESKAGKHQHLTFLAKIVANHLPHTSLLVIPFPSTNKDKSHDLQLPYILTARLNKLNPRWENGTGILYRKHSLPKNTRDEKAQYKSLGIMKERIKGKNIILLDDVTTSGSSLVAGLKAIQKAQPKTSSGWAIAKKVSAVDIALTSKF